MLKRHKVFNEILAFWCEHNKSSTPRRGQLLRRLADREMRMSRNNLKQHLNGLEHDGYIRMEGVVIVLLREEPIKDMSPVTLPD